MNVSQCDLQCPFKVYLEAAYRLADPARKLELVAKLGVVGAGLAMRAMWTCPARHDSVETFRADQTCADAARNAHAQWPLDISKLNERERPLLEPYINPEPPAIEG